MNAAVPLLAWQERYIEDHSRWKFLAASVQVGKSFATSLEIVLDEMERPSLWIMLSASDRQSIELMEKVKMHTAGMDVATDSGFFADTSIVQHTAKFPNGGRIIALPANPDTARGYSGNVFLDEFAIHRDAKSIWKALAGRALRGYKVRVASSYKGKQNKFYELGKELGLVAEYRGWEPEVNPVRNGVWSGHFVNLAMAVREGLKVDIDEMIEAVGDDDIVDEEFFCVPVEGALDFIGFELIQGCETPEARTEFDFEYREGQVAGFDIARRRDLSIIWILRPAGAPGRQEANRKLTAGVITMARKKFSEQKDVAREVARCVDRFCIDATGIGANLAEDLREAFPGVVEPIEFTGPAKEAMATQVKNAMEERAIGIPASVAIQRSLQAVKRFMTATGNIRFDAARTEAGHADEFWALALALQAGSQARGYVPASECGVVGKTVAAGMLAAEF
jgi:phage FluMu gp28-like protein